MGRATKHLQFKLLRDFISIHALRGEGDLIPKAAAICSAISIHALRGEGDVYFLVDFDFAKDFNPRPPWGGRHFITATIFSKHIKFQSTPSVGRATFISFMPFHRPSFQSTPSVGRATDIKFIANIPIRISIHALRGEGDE